MQAEPDAQLVRAIAAGHATRDAAEALLCRRFAPRVRLYGLRHLRDEERARDLVQSVLLAVLLAARAGRVEDPDRIDRYVLATARQVAARMRARDAREAPAEHADDPALSAALDEGLHAAADSAASAHFELGALVRCFDVLELRARKIVTLSFQYERSAEQIASELATSAGNVRVVRHRAIAALRRCLDANTGEAT